MRNVYWILCIVANSVVGQKTDLNSFLNDAIFFGDKYISTMSDAAVYQSSSAWMTSPRKRKLGAVTVGVNTNFFIVAPNDKTFQVANTDFAFLQIENQNTLNAQTALGGSDVNYLVGNLEVAFQPGIITSIPIRIETPKGIDQNVIIYPYLQAAVSLWYGTEIAVKYSTKTKLKKCDYQVYGFGIKHNLSQYFNYLQANKVHLAAMASLSKEEINFQFLDVAIPYIGSIGIDEIVSKVVTKQFQINVSKDFKNWELQAGLIVNNSDFKYQFAGSDSTNVSGLKEQLNEKIKEIAKNKTNVLGELSARYHLKKIFLQPTLAFGKFLNTNVAVQYEF